MEWGTAEIEGAVPCDDPGHVPGDTLVEPLVALEALAHGDADEPATETAELVPDSGVRRCRPRPVVDDGRRDPLARLGTCIGARFELLDVLGTGGMGAVYRARDRERGEDVAIKVLKAELAQNAEAVHRFLREARHAGALAHPNVIAIRDAGVESQSGLLYIVMELLDGETAADALDARGPFSLDHVLAIARGVLAGLGAAHRAGIIHRDLKPANVFLTRSGEVKLIDFGIAKTAPGNHNSLQLTTPGIVLGTPHYLSPEQARGQTDLDLRVDLYALGVVMFELLTGQTPFDRPGYVQVLAAICRESPKDLAELVPEVPPGVTAIVHRAMARSRDDRFASADEMLAAIAALASPAVREPAAPEPTIEPDRATEPSVEAPPESDADTSCEVDLPRAPAAPPHPSELRSLGTPASRGLSRRTAWAVAAAAALLATAGVLASVLSG